MATGRFDVVGFDCDGVMFDTRSANRAYYDQVLQHFGLPCMDDTQFSYVHMHTVNEAMKLLFPDEGLYRKAMAYRKTMAYASFLPLMTIEPDLRNLLAKLRGRCRTAVATNRSDTMIPLLQAHGLENSFDLVVTSLQVFRPKPSPDQLHLICDHFRIPSRRLLYIGDSEVDEAAARAAGARLAAYRNINLEADYHIQRLWQVLDILQ